MRWAWICMAVIVSPGVVAAVAMALKWCGGERVHAGWDFVKSVG